jgi:hypothetical protein
MYLAAVPQTNDKEKSILKVTVKTNPRGRFYRSHNFDCQNKSTISTATLNHKKYNQIVANSGKWQMANGKWQMANGKWQMLKLDWLMKCFPSKSCYLTITQILDTYIGHYNSNQNNIHNFLHLNIH